MRGSAIKVIESVPQTTSLQNSVARRTKSAGESAASAVSAVSAQKASTFKQMSLVLDASTLRMIVQGIVPPRDPPIWCASGCSARNASRRVSAPG